jgi:spore coat protein U-like protein
MESIKRITKRSVIRVAALGLGLLALSSVAAGPALAATSTTSLVVTALVTTNCLIATLPVAFGVYDPISAQASDPLDGTGTVTVTCTPGASATITLGQGSNPNTGSTDAVPLRRMADLTSDHLSYFLYQDSSRTVVWGNTSGTGVGHTGTGLPTAITIYGRIPGGQNVPFGVYTDTVVATVTF